MHDHGMLRSSPEPTEPAAAEALLEALASQRLDARTRDLLEPAITQAYAGLRTELDCLATLSGLLADAARAERMDEAHDRHFREALLGESAAAGKAAAEAGALHYHRGVELETTISAYGVLLVRLPETVTPADAAADCSLSLAPLLARGFLDMTRFSAGYVRAMREEYREVAEQLRELAYRDPLTGLANRRLFAEQLDTALRTARRFGHRVGLLRLDVDHFKSLNDSFGHEAGDAVLGELARRLRRCLRDADLPACVGGDEFAVVVPAVATAGHLAQIAERILEASRVPLAWEGQSIEFGISIGGTLSTDGVDAHLLLRTADRALYDVKTAGRGRYAFREARPGQVCPTGLLAHFARALDAGALVFHYQPQIDLASRRTVGVKALLRCACPPLARVGPDVLLRAVERSSLVHRFTAWALQQVARDMRRISVATGFRGIVAVNFSEAQLRDPAATPGILRLAAELAELDLRLEVEVTEDTFSGEDAEWMVQRLGALRSRGVLLALDDFGTGYASLAHLRRLPVDRLKIDRQFVGDMTGSGIARNIVKAVLGLARHLPAAVVAEGVERPDQVEQLRRFGCEAAQGYHFARPLPPDELVRFLRSRPLGEGEPRPAEVVGDCGPSPVEYAGPAPRPPAGA